MESKIYNALDDQLQKEWESLWASSQNSHFFNSPMWFLTCLKTYRYSKVLILTVYSDSQLVAVLPLVRAKKLGISVLMCPGGVFLDRSSLLLADINENLLLHIAKTLSKLGNFYLAEVEKNLADSLCQIFPLILKFPQPLSTSPYLPLESDPLRFVPSRHRSEINSILRKCQANISTSFISPSTQSDLQTIVELEKVSSKDKKHTEIFNNPNTLLFFRNLIDISPKSVGIILLCFDGQPIAGDIGYIYNSTFRGFYTAYDNHFRHLGPGKLLKYITAQELTKRGFVCYDLSRGLANYKSELTPHVIYQSDLYYSSNYLVLWWWKALNNLKNYLEKHPRLYETIRMGKNVLVKKLTYPSINRKK